MNRYSTTTAAAGALLVCAVALGGCGEQEEPEQETLGYGNYEPLGQQKRQQPETVGHITTDHAHVAE